MTSATSPTRSSFLLLRPVYSVAQVSTQILTGTVLSLVFFVFATYFPFFLAPQAAEGTYHFASYDYKDDLSHFDNTIWTWGTDYGLALAMGLLIWSFPKTVLRINGHSSTKATKTTTTISHVHVRRSQGMLLCYLLSVLAGGLAHQFYTTLESRAHWSFRFLWTICVGTVTAAPAFMGSVGTEMIHVDWETRLGNGPTMKSSSWLSFVKWDAQGAILLPRIPGWIWATYAIVSTSIVAWGGMSYQRPACDIFMAGITQTPSTAYLMVIFAYGLPRHNISNWTRVLGAVGFIWNAALLPSYPLLVQYTDLSLGAVNTILHCWLLMAWSTQGLCLRQMALAVEEYENNQQSKNNTKKE